ncbi:MAG: hypothetical protein LBR50_01185 [Tannerella sp.]|jgi:hypothetical protein|nr:hypothetical protein [Tannerella sp.]
MNLQEQYDKIYSFFKTTTETFDELIWDGNQLSVWLNNKSIEIYSREDVNEWFDL